jgi:hypothetical protein
MWASGGSSLFANFALIGIGYIFGKVQFLPTILQIFAELRALSNFEKVKTSKFLTYPLVIVFSLT